MSNNKDNETFNTFTAEQHAAILAFLEEQCNGEVCVSRPDIFEAVEDLMGDVEVDRFTIVLSNALKNNEFPGFKTRRGRSGGVHRDGAFNERDASKGVKVTKTQTPVEVDGNLVHAKLKATVLHKYLTGVLGCQKDENGNVKVENVAYNCTDVAAFNKYLTAMGGI